MSEVGEARLSLIKHSHVQTRDVGSFEFMGFTKLGEMAMSSCIGASFAGDMDT